MKLKKLVAGVAIAGGGVILVTTLLFKDEIHDWLFAIRRVRTWGDLMAQKPIRLSDGVVVRLGIEDTRCPQGSGVLLYCLTEGYDPSSRREVTDTAIGPLDVEVVEEGAKDDGDDSSLTGVFDVPLEKGDPAARWLFALTVSVSHSGRYQVTVSERGNALRHVMVEGTQESMQPWITLEVSARPLDVERTASLGRFLPCRGQPALPSRKGFLPYMDSSFRGLVDPARRLPGLLPDAHAPDELDLRKERDSLVVTSKSKLNLNRMNLAARWWINDEPYVPKDRSGFSFENSEPRPDMEQFHLEIDFDTSRGEFRSGDRLSLQLMYSDQSWSLTDGREGNFRFSEEHRVLQSNRIEMTVP